MIELHDVVKTYHLGDTVVSALQGVSLTIGPGEFVAITGPSGSGKSTLMHIIGLLDVPEAGRYRLWGRDIARMTDDQLAVLRRREVGFIFQDFHLLARTSAAENVSLPRLYSQGRHDLAQARELLEQVGLGDRAEHRPNELSGGQQQRVAIARALSNRPRILLADEPTGNLDSASRKEILDILTDLNRQGMTVIIVTHDDEVARVATRRIRMNDGIIELDSGPRAKPAKAQAKPTDPSSFTRRGAWRELWEHALQGLRALRLNKARTVLSMLGILIGVAAVVATLAVGRGAQEAIRQGLSVFGTNVLTLSPGRLSDGSVAARGATRIRLTLADAAAIKERVPGVIDAVPGVGGSVHVGFGNKDWRTELAGMDPGYAAMRVSQAPMKGRNFTEEENRRRARVAILGAVVVRQLFGSGQNPIGKTIRLNQISAEVIGVLPERGTGGLHDYDNVVVVPIRTAMRRILGREHVEWIDIQASSAAAMESVRRAAHALMLSRHRVPLSLGANAFEFSSSTEIQTAMEQSSRTMTRLLASIAAISLLVGGIGIMNIMLISVIERTGEIGLRKAIGARRGDIQIQFLIESAVISAVGGIVGTLVGWVASRVVTAAAGWSTIVTPGSVILALSFSVFVGLLFGIYPARRAATLAPIDALRRG